jgi:tetratricopeptide (TPR) repeat protein
MASIRTKTFFLGTVTLTLLFGTATLIPIPGSAQDAANLSNLVFEPILLSTAIETPKDLQADPEVDRESLLASVDQHLATIASLRDRRRSEGLIIDEFGLLGVAYQGLGRHEEALDALDEAVDMTVDEGGRDNLEQIPLQEQKLVSYRALRDIESADETEELIYSLYEGEYSKSGRQMYFATINLADWHTAAYYMENYDTGRQTLRGQQAVIQRARRSIGNPGAEPDDGESDSDITTRAQPGSIEAIFSGDIKSVFDQDITDPRLKKIDQLYADYQNAIAQDSAAQLDIVVDIAKRVARLAFITKQEMDYERDNPAFDPNYEGSREQAARNSPLRRDESYKSGEEALEYVVGVLRSVDGVRQDVVAAALLDLGDWHLAFGRTAAAQKSYDDAYQVLLSAGFSPENIDLALATVMPPQIPVFAPHLYSRASRGIRPDAKLDYQGYVDVGYSIDELGNATDVAFLGASTEDYARLERMIAVQLRSMKFRPTLSGAERKSPGRIEARYYYAY